MVIFVRYVLPGLILLGRMVILVFEPNETGLHGFAMAAGSGGAVLLLNVLYRIGARGDIEREEEDAARDFYTEHGYWPDEQPAPKPEA